MSVRLVRLKRRKSRMNIMIVGVGGQGTLLASRILGKVAIKDKSLFFIVDECF